MLKQRIRKTRIAVAEEPPLIGPCPVRRVSNRSKEETEAGMIEVSGFIAESRLIRFKKPLRVDVYREGPYWIHNYRPLEIDGIGSTREESKQQFLSHLLLCWREYGQAPDSVMDSIARKFKETLLALVDDIDPIG